MEDWSYRSAGDIDLSMKEALKSVKREMGLGGVLAGLVKRPFLLSYLSVYHRLSVTGRHNLPATAPFVLVSNHCSHLDAPVLSALVSFPVSCRLFPIAAGDTFFESYASSALSAFLMNALPLWRKSVGAHALALLRARLVEEPCAYILFPEGTRSRSGRMVAFKPGIGKLVAGRDVPVVPVHISGTFGALSPTASFPKPHRIHVRIGPPRNMKDRPNSRDGWMAIAAELERSVMELASEPE